MASTPTAFAAESASAGWLRPVEARNTPECLAILHDAGFTGPLVIGNYVARELNTDPLDELRRAKAFVEKTLGDLAQNPVPQGAASQHRPPR